MDNRFVSVNEFVKSWAAENSHTGRCSAHVAPTIDHKIIVTAVGYKDWFELPGSDANAPISRSEKKQIADWLKQALQ